MKIIVGLGNPGKIYEMTRHNLGFLVVEALAEKLGLVWQEKSKWQAQIAKTSDLILVKPISLMNNSGQSVAKVLSYFKLLPKRFGLVLSKNIDLSKVLTVVHDDLDISLGKYKISVGSRSAGHKGVQSIIEQLKTKNFTRWRFGIYTAAAEKLLAEKYVLENFSQAELKMLAPLIDKVVNQLIMTLEN